MPEIRVKLFYRENRPNNFSIERVFELVKKSLADRVVFDEYYLPGRRQRFLSTMTIGKQASGINHITGDVYFLGIGLPAQNTIITVHDIGHFERTLRGLKKWVYKWIWLKWPLSKAKYITSISQFTKDRMVETLGIPAAKIRVIYNPYPAGYTYSPKTINRKNPVILQIGNGMNKNREGLIHAVRNIPCKVIFIGELSEEHKKLLAQFQIAYENPVNVTAEEMYKYYQFTDIVYFASYYEGFGLPIIEAQAVGRPVITSDCASMPEVAGEGALIVNPDSVDEIRDAIKRIMNHDQTAEDLILKGQENIKRFAPSVIAGQYYQLYSEVWTGQRK